MKHLINTLIQNEIANGNFKIKQIRTCEVCGSDISHLKAGTRFCCRSCWEKAKRKQKRATIACSLCGDMFAQTHAKQIYCLLCDKEQARASKRNGESVKKQNVSILMLKSIDGEAIKHGEFTRKTTGEKIPLSSYVMLQSDGVTPLFADCLKDSSKPIKRLGSKQIFDWLCSNEFMYTVETEDGKTKRKAYTIVGYYLNYDFENWLVDVPDDDYLSLVDGNIIDFQGYKISYVPKKMMHIWKERPLWKDGKPVLDNEGNPKVLKYSQRDILDHAGYWARSFIKVLDANKDLIETNEQAIIEEFKAKRNIFTIENWQEIAEYNNLECVLLTRIVNKLVKTMQKAFPESGIEIAVTGKDLYSPKALANKFFKNIKWKEKHPFFEWKDEDQKQGFHDTFISNEDGYDHLHESINKTGMAYAEQFGGLTYDETKLSKFGAKTLQFPFSAAFFGGRIESGQVGYWSKIYGYDINSAYPAAMAKMMEWLKDDMTFTKDVEIISDVVNKRIAGMFLIKWWLSDDLAFYPFPYRDRNNVYFPSHGYGWVSCLEVYAWMDSCRFKPDEYRIEAALYLDNTEGLGDIKYLTEGFNDTNKAWWKIYNARLEMKRLEFTNTVTGEKLSKNPNYGKTESDSGYNSEWVQTKFENPAEYGTKIVYNAAYGGTVQQVGVKDWQDEKGLKVFHDFTAMWITAYCRATIWQAIAPVVNDKNAIVAIQTDGIYSTIPLDVPTPKEKVLGLWEESTHYDFINLQAGIYSYAKKPDLPLVGKHRQLKQRGWSSSFDFNQAYETLKTGSEYSITSDSFIPRGFALHQKHALEGCALQWIPISKDFVCNLNSKRQSPNHIILAKQWKHIRTGKIVNKKPIKKYEADYIAYTFEDSSYCPPKRGSYYMSTPFKLKFDDLLIPTDKFKDEKYLSECMEGNEGFYAAMGE